MDIVRITYEDFENRLKAEGTNIEDLPLLAVNKLREKGVRIATAESCTGGLISKLITDISGASEIFDCGVCSYANRIKESLLRVDKEDLERCGAVSPEVAAQMAQGVRKLAAADIGVSTTGVAGPGGGTEEKPVGLIYVAISDSTETRVIMADFTAKNATRDKNRLYAASLVLYCVIHSF